MPHSVPDTAEVSGLFSLFFANALFFLPFCPKVWYNSWDFVLNTGRPQAGKLCDAAEIGISKRVPRRKIAEHLLEPLAKAHLRTRQSAPKQTSVSF